MVILTPEEQEKLLFDSISKAYSNKKRLLIHDSFSDAMQYYDNDFDEYKEFLIRMAENGFIKFDGNGIPVIMFGDRVMEWRKRLAQAFPDQPQQIANQTFNFNHANHVQAAGRDITNTFTEYDAEKVIRVLKENIPQDTPSGSGLGKIREILDCGKSAMEILKSIGAFWG